MLRLSFHQQTRGENLLNHRFKSKKLHLEEETNLFNLLTLIKLFTLLTLINNCIMY